ncbi:MAG: UDP-N-acetylmuramoyl-L-alanine--D-glutamate ligase [Bacteroidales bacterium]|nr:UDP-N-acetylmuramoyl-L-alanine--D-glutamate ligase [Bacteroidales bacterium]
MKKRIVILGAGESGVGAAVLAKRNGYDVFVSDLSRIREKYKKVLLNHDIKFEEGKHTPGLLAGTSEVVKSPGIPDDVRIVRELRKNGAKVISEIEFAGRYSDAFKICISGSNGKTTTTCLTHHIVRKAGYNAALAGNVGQSYAFQVAQNSFEVDVLELSSFQLDGMFDFKADIAVLLNITPDHLDRYSNSFELYVKSKFRILQNLTGIDVFVFNYDDPVIRGYLDKFGTPAQLYPFSLYPLVDTEGAWLDGNKIVINIKSILFTMTLEKLALQGKHNIYNSMAATIACRILDIRKSLIKESLVDFQNIEHRLEYVAKIHGVEFVNDSKATNVNSCWYALESINKPIVWVAGGIDKGNDYEILRGLVKQKVKTIICLGKDNSEIIKAFKNEVEDIYEATTMEEVVRLGLYLAKQDEVVLLSPACASFDLFENFEDRGNQFKDAVNKL